MLQGQDIICFCNDWDADPLSKKHIMTRLARHNRILWINSIGNRRPTASARDMQRIAKKLREFARGCRQVQENIHVFSPLAIPVHGNAAARWTNRAFLNLQVRWQCSRLGFRDPITYTFVPWSADIVGTLGEKMVIYHITDDFTGFTGADKQAMYDMEQRLIEKSAAVISSAGRLQEKVHSNTPSFLVTHGVDVEHFRKACDPATPIPAELTLLPKPVIGFIGLIEDWVDLALIRHLAQARPAWSFVLVGKIVADDSAVRGLPNVHLVGRKSYESLPGYCKAFDAALLPFVINELTLAANPLKLREYLAAGLPVVASAIPEAERLQAKLAIAHTEGEYLQQLDKLLAAASPESRLATSRSMDNETWDRKVEEISDIIERAELGPACARAALA